MSTSAGHPRVVLIGNPNTGKTTLFNRLCGLRHKTSNFPGTTLETRVGRVRGESAIDLIDSPGAYSLNLNQTESQITRDLLNGGAISAAAGVGLAKPDAVCVVADAMNLPRSLQLVGEVLRFGRPMAVAVNMADLAAKRGVHIDVGELARQLGVPCVCACNSLTSKHEQSHSSTNVVEVSHCMVSKVLSGVPVKESERFFCRTE